MKNIYSLFCKKVWWKKNFSFQIFQITLPPLWGSMFFEFSRPLTQGQWVDSGLLNHDCSGRNPISGERTSVLCGELATCHNPERLMSALRDASAKTWSVTGLDQVHHPSGWWLCTRKWFFLVLFSIAPWKLTLPGTISLRTIGCNAILLQSCNVQVYIRTIPLWRILTTYLNSLLHSNTRIVFSKFYTE